MSKVDRFIDALTKDVDLAKASFMGMSATMLIQMLRTMVSDAELEKLINHAVEVWGELSAEA